MPEPIEISTPEVPDASVPASLGMNEWKSWKESPTPNSMATVLRTVQPAINSAVRRFPNINPVVLGGEAKRLAIQAIKTYDPVHGAALPTHLFNHLRSLGRTSQTMAKAVSVPRPAREAFARYSQAKNDFVEERGREPHDHELQDILGVNQKVLQKLHGLGSYEMPEGAVENDPDVTDADDRRLDLWSEYVYHDLNDRDKLIVDMRLGRNGQKSMETDAIAAKLKIHPSYVNRKAQEIAEKILEGVNRRHSDV